MPFDLEGEADYLAATAEWRLRTAEDDKLNLKAAELCERLAKEVRDLKDDELLRQRLDTFEARLQAAEPGYVTDLSDYRSRLGFWYFPADGREYLNAIIALLPTGAKLAAVRRQDDDGTASIASQ
jgi:hypothetical protein